MTAKNHTYPVTHCFTIISQNKEQSPIVLSVSRKGIHATWFRLSRTFLQPTPHNISLAQKNDTLNLLGRSIWKTTLCRQVTNYLELKQKQWKIIAAVTLLMVLLQLNKGRIKGLVFFAVFYYSFETPDLKEN